MPITSMTSHQKTTVKAALTMVFQSGQAVAVLLGQRLIGAKQF